MENINQRLFDFIKSSPTSFHAASAVGSMLLTAGFEKLSECGAWQIKRGGKYFVTRNSSSVIAFKVPENGISGFMLSAAHSDSPAFKIKENMTIKDKAFVRLPVEKYGSMLCATWFDRPLAVAGRLVVRTKDGVDTKLTDTKRPVCIIPSVAIHMNRGANDNASYNLAKDMLPLAALGDGFRFGAGIDGDDVISSDLFVYVPERGTEFNGIISAPRLDDLQCTFASVSAFIPCTPSSAMPVMCIFDNEEVGSATKQGAASTFLDDVLSRISSSLGMTDEDLKRALASSMMVSCDNAHSVHPNHPEYADCGNDPVMGGGIVIKYNANQKYTTDAVSASLFKLICEAAGVPTQRYANRADIPGGSTLGSIANTKVSVNTIDIGLAQLAMHSAFETAGAADTEYMIRALGKFFSSKIAAKGDGTYVLL